MTLWATPSQEKRSRARSESPCEASARRSGSSCSQRIRRSAICSTASSPRSNDSSGRRSSGSAPARIFDTSASPECAAETGSTPQEAASAATMPNASGQVLGTTCAWHEGSRSGRSEYSSRPVKWMRPRPCAAASA